MCFILQIIFFHFLGKKKFGLNFSLFGEKVRIIYFSLFGEKKSSDYIFFTFFGKKMANRMKFSDDISDYFQMITQFERKSRKICNHFNCV